MTTISDERLEQLIVSARRFELDEYLSAFTELQSLRALGGVKPLVWTSIGPRGSDVEAVTPLGTYTMSFDAPTAGGGVNLWMAGSDSDTFTVHENRREAKAAAQADYERRILSSLEASPAPVSEVVAENKRLREAIEYYEIGVCAVGVPHEEERKVLHDCVREARALAAKGGQ